ncbi:MAG: hypothetical protein ACKO5K_09160 [Armatimonadota bacterium]
MAIAIPALIAGTFWFGLATIALMTATGSDSRRGAWAIKFLPTLLALELLAWGIPAIPSADTRDVFPETAGIAWLRRNAADAIIAPINRGWSLSEAGPGSANPVLVPNSLLRWRLRDAGGYDSLILRATKDRIRETGGVEPSPPENGNMVFIRDLEIAERLGAGFAVLPPGAVPNNPHWTIAYTGEDCTIVQSTVPPLENPSPRTWTTASVRLALFVVAVDAAVLLMVAGWRSPRRQRGDAKWNQITTAS